MRDTKYNSLDKVKKQIDDILYGELCGCRYAIYVHYSADNGGALFSHRIKDNRVQLSINIQTVMTFVERNDWELKTSICFCAWYVAGYIEKLMEWEQKEELNTYCAGVTFSEVLYVCFSNKKVKVFVPYICEKLGRCIKKMSVLDALCEANTLLRIKTLLFQELSQDERAIMERVLDERMVYLNAPEVIYVGLKTPSLSVKEVVRNIRIIGKTNTKISIPILPKKDDKKLIHNLVEVYEIKQDMFWIELLAHILMCSPNNTQYIVNSEVLNKIYESIEKYESRLIDDIKTYELSKDKICTDNLTIMLKYIERSKRLLLKAEFVRRSKRTIHINY